MELAQLQYFLEVANSEHITKSAEKLHIAQPALSQSIRRLEEELGVPLFAKNGRNITITRYGKYLQEKVAPFIKTLDQLPRELSEMQSIEKQTIYINVLAASTLITNVIIKFQSLHEEVKIKLLQNSEERLYDIEVNTRLFFQHNDELDESCFVYPERIFLAVPNAGKYSSMESIELAETENEGFISLMGSRQFRTICDKFCHHVGIRPNYIFESDNPAAVQNMIAANMGVGFWPEFSWGKLQNKKVKLLPISDVKCSRDLIITLNKSNRNGIAEELFEYLKDYLCKAQ